MTFLPALPIPNLSVTLKEIRRTLECIVATPEELMAYDQALVDILPVLEDKTQVLAEEMAKTSKNFATPRFQQFLLSRDGPMFESLTFVLALKKLHNQTILNLPRKQHQPDFSSLALLLYAMACFVIELRANSFVKEEKQSIFSEMTQDARGNSLDLTQLEQLFATVRLPRPHDSPEEDILRTCKTSRHVLVWCKGHPFRLEILLETDEGKEIPVSPIELMRSLEVIYEEAGQLESLHYSLASLSSQLTRSEWSHVRSKMTRRNPIVFQEHLETAIVSVALECEKGEEKLSNRLQDIRLGLNSLNRYADQTMGIISYFDGVLGISCDHAVADGGVGHELAECLVKYTRDLNHIIENTSHMCTTGFVKKIDIDYTDLPLQNSYPALKQHYNTEHFSLGNLNGLAESVITEISSSGLLHCVMNLTLQGSLMLIFKSEINQSKLVIEPVSVRHFYNGRCDPCYSITKDSKAFLERFLEWKVKPSNFKNDAYEKDMIYFFEKAVLSRKNMVKNVKLGNGVGTHMSVVREILQYVLANDSETSANTRNVAAASFIIDMWNAYFSGFNSAHGIVYLTGFDNCTDVIAGLGNIFSPNQLACWFTRSSTDCSLSITLAASGNYGINISKLRECFDSIFIDIALFALMWVKTNK